MKIPRYKFTSKGFRWFDIGLFFLLMTLVLSSTTWIVCSLGLCNDIVAVGIGLGGMIFSHYVVAARVRRRQARQR